MSAEMRVLLLGSAAGGGYPQWNCLCNVCCLAWAQDPRVQRRTQSSLAASADGSSWVLLNCSPDIREQIAATAPLWPRENRHSPIQSVVLSNADIDHIGGLLSLRERTPLTIWATAKVRNILLKNPIMKVLARDMVQWREFRPEVPFEPAPGVTVEAFMTPGKLPLYAEQDGPATSHISDANVAFILGGPTDKRLVYAPGCAAIDGVLQTRLAAADVVLFDGTLYRDDELIRAGVGLRSSRRMGHLPIDGSDGSLAALRDLTNRRIYTHINNTNPVLIADTPERRAVESAGWEVAFDGMELQL